VAENYVNFVCISSVKWWHVCSLLVALQWWCRWWIGWTIWSVWGDVNIVTPSCVSLAWRRTEGLLVWQLRWMEDKDSSCSKVLLNLYDSSETACSYMLNWLFVQLLDV